MLRVTAAPEPPTFDDRVRQPGVLAIHERTGRPPPIPRRTGNPCERATTSVGQPIDRPEDLERRHFPPYWTRALDDLFDSYHRVCSYSCFAIHEITGARSVDHMIPLSDAWDRVYEWGNYRLAATTLNARKQAFRDVLDPFEVGDDWFHMEFVRFGLGPNLSLPEAIRERITTTIDRLKLNGDKHRRRRQKDFTRYERGEITLAILIEESPLVARETTRTGRLHPTDAPPVDGSSNAPG